jgi:hypothetical protein
MNPEAQEILDRCKRFAELLPRGEVRDRYLARAAAAVEHSAVAGPPASGYVAPPGPDDPF